MNIIVIKTISKLSLANITLIISDEAGFESLCLVAALCSVTHRVGEAGELSCCEKQFGLRKASKKCF